MGVVAFRPAATFRRQGMGIYAVQLNTLAKSFAVEIEKGVGIPIAKCPLKVEQVEQVTLGLYFGRMPIHQGEQLRRIMMHCTTIRTVEPFDWKKLLQTWCPDILELHEGNRVYYKLKPGTTPQLGKAPAFFIPDG